MSFWMWFLGRPDPPKPKVEGEERQEQVAKPGFVYILNWRLLIDAVIGTGLAFILPKTPTEMATAVLIPLSGALIGLTFAWAGNAQALLQSSEISLVGKKHPGGINHFACTYQLAILVLLVTMALWSLAAAGISDHDVINCSRWASIAVKALLIALVSTCFRECWSVINSFRILLVSRDTVAQAVESNPKPGKESG